MNELGGQIYSLYVVGWMLADRESGGFYDDVEVILDEFGVPVKLGNSQLRIPRMPIRVSTRSRSESHLNLATMVG